MEEKKEISQLFGQNVEIQLADGKTYKLGTLGVLDLIYFEEKFGSVDVLYKPEKQFTIIMHVLYCVLKKNHPDLRFEDLDTLLPFYFLNQHPEIIETISSRITGGIKQENPPKPAEVQGQKL